MQFSFAGAAAALLTLAAAADLTLYLPPKPNPFTLPANTHATLNSLHRHHSAPLSSVNTFVFRNVTPGESYLLDVYCSEHAYTPLRIDVGLNGDMKAWETYRGNDWANKGEEYPILEGSMGRGVELRFIGAKNYFAERPKFSVLTILKNPMILMGIASMAMFVGMPYLMDSMDPEMRAEFEARQKAGPMASLLGAASGGGAAQQQQSPIGNFDMAAYLAGSKESSSGGKETSGNGGAARNQGVRR